MTEPIYFYSKNEDYYELSNFAPFGFEEDRAYWPTVEHYFQAQKFPGEQNTAYRERIRTARSPKDAKALGQSRTIPLRSDWEDVKEKVMLHALRRKFARSELRKLLLSTSSRPLIEASPSDYYWGIGKDGTGQNRLGVLLMQVRDAL